MDLLDRDRDGRRLADDARTYDVPRERAYDASTVVRDDPAADPLSTRPAFVEPVRSESTYVTTAPAIPEPPSFSLGATFLGWAVASFFTGVFLVLAALAFGLVGADAASDDVVTRGEAENVGLGFLVAAGIAVLLGYFLGGYAAGRIALVNGAAHGAGVVAWSVLAGLLALAAGWWLVDSGQVQVSGVDTQELTTLGLAAAVVSFILALAGSMLGGRLGARYDDLDGDRVARRGVYRRGRPL